MWKTVLMLCLVMNEDVVLSKDRGVQVRLTRKALDYALNVEVKRLEENLRTNTFNLNGKSGSVSYELSNTRIKDVQFPSRSVTPVPGVGLQVKVNDASILVEGEVMYRYKKWLINIGHTISITARARGVDFQMTLGIGADGNGRPTVNSERCRGNVGDVDIDFHGGLSWIYNIFSGWIESILKEKLNDAICDSAIRAVEKNVKPELSTFSVSKKIDQWAILDYRLMGSPMFTSNYIDVYIKGEFQNARKSMKSYLPFTNFVTGNDASRMVYFWLSEYTANTAGEVYHNSGRLDFDVHGWESRVPQELRKLLSTKNIEFMAPSIYKKYPDVAMGIHLKSYKAPQCNINKHGVRFFVYAHADVSVQTGARVVPVFGMTLNVNTTVAVNFQDGNLVVQIKDDTFQYYAEVYPQYKDIVAIPLNSQFMYGILRTMIVEEVNKKLKRGLPLPNLEDVGLKDTSIEFRENAIRIVSDVELKRLF